MGRGTQSYTAPCNINSYVLQEQGPLVSSLSEKINKVEEKIAEEIGKFIYDRQQTSNPLSDHSATARGVIVLLTKY